MNTRIDPNDPNTWPIADAVPSDVFLGSFVHDCTPNLTDEQVSWPVADCEPSDAVLSFDEPRVLTELINLYRALNEFDLARGGTGLNLRQYRSLTELRVKIGA